MQKGKHEIENKTYLQKKTKRLPIVEVESTSNKTNPISNIKPLRQKINFRILEPYRSLGLITDNNKAVFFKRNTDRFMLCSNETSFLVYNLEKLRLERISPPLDHKITALGYYKNKILTGINGKVQLWDKIHIIQEYAYQSNPYEIKQILTFDNVLLYTNSIGDLFIFNIDNGELITHLKLRIDTFIHPTSYFNRILFNVLPEKYELDLNLVNYSPTLVLYNINSEKEIFNYKDEMKREALITCLEQSPVIDIVGIGYSNGDILLFNIKSSKKILTLKSEYEVNMMSFSTCTSMKHSLLATVSLKGDINLWDLNKKTIHFTLSQHFTKISSIMFLVNEPILLCSSGEDNSIKMFILDYETSFPSLLKYRNGHCSSPKYLRFYGDDGYNGSNHILSIDSFLMRNMSVIKEHLSTDFSVKKYKDYLNHRNVLKSFDYNEFRERDWANIALCADNLEYPLLFSYENNVITEKQPQLKTKLFKCTSVCISMCGNFGFCGFENGSIEQFNMQSGLSRWIIPNAHNKTVSCLKSDGINSMLISISQEEKGIKFWEIYKHSLIQTIELNYHPHQIELNRDNELVGVSLSNNEICLYDKSQIKLVRQFQFDKGDDDSSKCDISDFNISKNAKWLIGLIKSKKSLKIFEILSSNLIEWITFDYEPLSIAISPNNHYIALSFDSLKGIYLYLNRTLFIDFEDIESITSPIHCVLNTFKAKKLKKRRDFTLEEANRNELNYDNEKMKLGSDTNTIPMAIENTQLISLSNQNNMKYRIIYNLEEIQERNEPKMKNKEKAKAPFFLFNLNDVIESKLPMKLSSTSLSNSSNSPEYLNILKNYSHFKNEKSFEQRKLLTKENDFILKRLLLSFKNKKTLSSEITSFLNTLNPYVLDLEIRSMDPLLDVDATNYLEFFLDYLMNELNESSSNFEMLQAYLNRFIKVFSENIISNKELQAKIANVNSLTEHKFSSVNDLYKSTMCLISYFGKIQL